MPLVWAHAEFLKLLAADANKRPAELLDAVESRYGRAIPKAPVWHWRLASPVGRLPPGKALLIENGEPFLLHFGLDGWEKPVDRKSAPTQFGMHGVMLTAKELKAADSLIFTLYFPGPDKWIGKDFEVELGEG
jgi:glucoamylase